MRIALTRSTWTTSAHAGVTSHALRGPGGAVAEIAESPGAVTLQQDVVRSFPLFYGQQPDGEWVVSDAVHEVVTALAARGLNPQGAREFRELMYVTGAETLHPGVHQVQSGETIELTDGHDAKSVITRRLGIAEKRISTDAAADELFSDALHVTFGTLLESLKGRQVVVPLSGGLDSRLIAVLLRDLGYDNVVNFTYGVGETREAQISREVASSLQQRWELVSLSRHEVRSAWHSADTAAFVADAYAGASLPHIQDWYALRMLRDREIITPDAVFLPGHTVVGNMHNAEILDVPGAVSPEAVRDIIVRTHAVMHRDGARTLLRDQTFLTKFDTHLELHGYDGSPASRLVAIEGWNLRERQTKYINNSMRAYEHFGYDWALPMLEEPVLQAWEAFDVSLRRDRAWYERYVTKRFAESSGNELSTFAPTNIKASTRSNLKAVLRAVGALGIVERRMMARAYAQHPMAFQAFIEESAEAQIFRAIARGDNPFSVYIDRFLQDAWAPGQNLFSA